MVNLREMDYPYLGAIVVGSLYVCLDNRHTGENAPFNVVQA
jgi:hypothetical protein